MADKQDELHKKITTGELVYLSQANDWNRFFQLIKSKLPNGVEIPNPPILGGAGASNYIKNQIEKAMSDVVAVIENFMEGVTLNG